MVFTNLLLFFCQLCSAHHGLQTHKMTRNRHAKGPPGLPGSAGESGDTGEAGEAQGAVCGSGAEVLKYEEFPTLNPGYTVKIHSTQGDFWDTLINFHLFHALL